jgi:16S rRNA (uracil1498-N3)-methyltransferase
LLLTMPDYRVHVSPPPPLEACELVLTAAESHHLVQVNRARPGDLVTAFDGQGHEWICVLEPANTRKTVHLRVVSQSNRPPLACALLLGQGLPKGGTMDEIVRQATELGAAVIAPLSTNRSEVHLDPDRAAKKVDKWRVATVEAAKQCGNPWVPRVEPIQTLAAFLTSPAVLAAELRLIASLQPGALALHDILSGHRATHGRGPASVAWLVGPEGDFSPEETGAALDAGWLPVSLGPLVLRCDTAAVYALATLRCATEGS